MEDTALLNKWQELAIKAGFNLENNDDLLPPQGAIDISPELMRFAAYVRLAALAEETDVVIKHVSSGRFA